MYTKYKVTIIISSSASCAFVRQFAKKKKGNGTYLAAVIDGYYFPAHGVCLKRAADVPALDSVHLKFSVWVHFLRQTNAA